MIQKSDVERVAKDINIELTDKQISEVLELYPSEADNDPTGTWDLIVENCIYNIIE